MTRETCREFFYLYLYISMLIMLTVWLSKIPLYCTRLPCHPDHWFSWHLALRGLVHPFNTCIDLYFYCFPTKTTAANQLWQSGWRPESLWFMMTTFKELPKTTEIVLQSIVNECKRSGFMVDYLLGLGRKKIIKSSNNFLTIILINRSLMFTQSDNKNLATLRDW